MNKKLKIISSMLLVTSSLFFTGCTNNLNLEIKNNTVAVKTYYEYGNKENSLSQLQIINTFNDEIIGNIIINIDSYPFKTTIDLCKNYNSYADIQEDKSHIKPCLSEIVVKNLRQSYSMFIKEQRLNMHNIKEGSISLISRSSNPNFFLEHGKKTINLGESKEVNYLKNETFKRKILFKVLN